jgi:ABC-type lipoprotein release transport system permease subunit
MMLSLAWANLKRRKLRSTISVLAITFIIMMIVSVFAIADGLTGEVGDRMSSVQAELIVLPAGANLAVLEGEGFGPKAAERIAAIEVPDPAAASQPASRPAVEAVIPVYVKKTVLGGQDQRIYGIDPAQWKYFGGQRKTVAGLPLSNGLQLLIDKRLAGVHDPRLIDGHFDQANRTVRIMEHDFHIVGVVESGVIGRVFMPLATMRDIYAGGVQNSTCFFVKLRDGIDRDDAAKAIEDSTHQTVLVTEKVGQQLRDDMRLIFRAINGITGISLVVGLGVIVLTVYTMILERRREIAILKSLGAGTFVLLRQVLTESLLLCLPGTLLGIGLSYLFATVFMALRPLDTLVISGRLLALAIGGGVGVSVLAALICGASAARQDAVAALSME